MLCADSNPWYEDPKRNDNSWMSQDNECVVYMSQVSWQGWWAGMCRYDAYPICGPMAGGGATLLPTQVASPTPAPTVGCCWSLNGDYRVGQGCLEDIYETDCNPRVCKWVTGDDAAECMITTTVTPQEAGCCYGEGVRDNEMCGNKVGRDQCERNRNCEFRAGDDADCTYVPTMRPSEPWSDAQLRVEGSVLSAVDNAQSVALMAGGALLIGAAAFCWHMYRARKEKAIEFQFFDDDEM